MVLQSVEAVLRRLFLGALVRLAGGRREARVPDWRARPYRVLFIRDDGIGDLIVSVEAMRAIAESSPTITLDVLASPQNAPLARTLPFVNEVIVHKRQFLLRAWPLWRRLRRNAYGAVVDGRVASQGVSTQTACILLSTGAPWRIGEGGRRNDEVYTVRIPPKRHAHWSDHIVALAAPFGVGPDSRDWRPRLQVPEADISDAERMWEKGGGGRPRVLVNVSVGHPERSWPAEKFAIVLARIRERLPQATIVLAGMPAEHGMIEDLARPVGGFAAPLTLPQVIAAVSTADLLVSPSTAVTHAASAFQTPTLMLERRDHDRWSPYRTPGRTVFSDDEPRLSTLPAERVIEALDATIEELGPGRGWPTRNR